MMMKQAWGDSQVWMQTAIGLFEASDMPIARRNIGYPGTNQLNVAYVCTAYAFEFIFKALVKAAGDTPPGDHEIHKIYNELTKDDRAEVKRLFAEHGYAKPGALLDALDAHYTHGDRKYWMEPKPSNREGQEQTEKETKSLPLTFHFGGKASIPDLARLHGDLSELARERITTQERLDEIWPGFPEASF